MDEQGLPIFITLIISAVIIGVFVFAAAIINAILQTG
jgi:hypothetical protein